jgi:hypothetical protein
MTKEHRLLGGDAPQDGQEGVEGLLLLLLGRYGQGSIVSGQWKREERGKERYRFCEWQAILHHESLQFAELLLWGLVPVELQHHMLQQLNQRIQGGVLVIRRTLTRRQPRLRLGGHVFRQHLDEARFADARLAAEQHHLPHALFDLRPALLQQRHLLLAAHERGQASAASGL